MNLNKNQAKVVNPLPTKINLKLNIFFNKLTKGCSDDGNGLAIRSLKRKA